MRVRSDTPQDSRGRYQTEDLDEGDLEFSKTRNADTTTATKISNRVPSSTSPEPGLLKQLRDPK